MDATRLALLERLCHKILFRFCFLQSQIVYSAAKRRHATAWRRKPQDRNRDKSAKPRKGRHPFSRSRQRSLFPHQPRLQWNCGAVVSFSNRYFSSNSIPCFTRSPRNRQGRQNKVLPIAHPPVSPLSGLNEIFRPCCLGLTPPGYCISPLPGLGTRVTHGFLDVSAGDVVFYGRSEVAVCGEGRRGTS